MSDLDQEQTSPDVRFTARTLIENPAFAALTSENTHYRKQPNGHQSRLGELVSAYTAKIAPQPMVFD
jgi:hypothetical protein